MKKHITLLVAALLLMVLVPAFADERSLLLDGTSGLKEPYFLQVLPLAKEEVALLSPKNLYLLREKDDQPQRIFGQQGSLELKRLITFESKFFLVTEKGLFLSEDTGNRWKEISPLTLGPNEIPLSIEIREQMLLFGTTEGLYTSSVNEIRFKKVDHFPKDEAPLEIRAVSKSIYFILTDRSLWKTRDEGMSFEKLLGNVPNQIENRESENDESAKEDDRIMAQGSFTSLEVDREGRQVWVGSRHGIFKSDKGGLQFSKLSSLGLRSDSIIRLLWCPPGLIAATREGIYYQQDKDWVDLNPTLNSKPVYDVTLQDKKVLMVSEGGVFTTPLPSLEIGSLTPQEFQFDPDLFNKLDRFIKNEPSVREVQKAAIAYSKTKNGKIRSWQILSRLRALVPAVSYRIGKSRSSSVDLDRGGALDPDAYITGPESWDKDRDVSVNWDLGDFLFSPAQTSIDSRDKLMVELRDEIVSEVTRLYFERRRLQMDLLFSKPEGKALLDLWIRIEELTAQIDGLCGGWFSKKMKHGNTTLEDAFRSSHLVSSSSK